MRGIVIRAIKITPEPFGHDGHEWIYGFSGQVRLVLGDDDWVLARGGVVRFESPLPRWFGSAKQEPVEVVRIFTGPCERMPVRGASASR